MRRCSSCKIENDDAQYYCAYCGTVLLNDREIEWVQTGKCLRQEKKFGLLEFLKEFQPLFVILGVFGALSFYLLTFLSNKSEYQIFLLTNNSVLVNQSNVTNFGNVQNLELVGKISSINPSLLNSNQLVPIESSILLQIAMFCSFLIFFLVLAIIIQQADRIESFSKWIIIGILIFLFIPFFVFLLNSFASVGLAVLLGILFYLVMMGYYKLHIWFIEFLELGSLKGFTFIIEPTIWILIYFLIRFAINLLNNTEVNDPELMVIKISVYFIIFGIFGGIVLTILISYNKILRELIEELSIIKKKIFKK
jgi:hypothetical protein